MSKVSIDSADAPKKVTRKRAVKSVVSNDAEVSSVPSRVRSTPSGQTTRKAPARITLSETKPDSSKRYLKVLVVIAILLVVSVWVGVSDSGQIDVNARITERNNKVTNGETSGEANSSNPQSVVVPVQNTAPSVPNAGLHGRGIGTVNVPDSTQVAAEAATTSTGAESATTTDVATASTTIEESGEGKGAEIVQ